MLDTLYSEQADRILDVRFRCADMSHPLHIWLRSAARKRLAEQLRTGTSLSAFTPESLHAAVPRSPELARQMVCIDSMESLLPKIKLPSLPQVFYELQNLMERDDVTIDELAQTVSLDPNMTGAILRLVNSALFNFRASIDTVTRAITVLGMRQVSALALGTLLLGLFRERPCTVANLELFWQHSIGVGMVARSLARNLEFENPERFFVAGLVHDIGWLALACAKPEMVQLSMDMADETNTPLWRQEKQVLGFSHAELGAGLFSLWSLPESLVDSVRYHHTPSECMRHDEALLVHVADVVVKGMGYGSSADSIVPDLDVLAWDALDIAPEELASVVAELEAELTALCRILLG